MKEKLIEILLQVGPILAGFVASIIAIFRTNKSVSKRLQNRIDAISPNKEIEDLKKEMKEVRRELAEIKKEILEMRGKRK